LNTPAGQNALQYLREKRGLKDETVEAFGIGYAPNSWDATLKHFLDAGHPLEHLVAAGLLSQRTRDGASDEPPNRSNVYDRFRHRVMFPIRDERGRMAGFGARILNPDDVPKFLNSPQTPIFDKGRLLYGLDRARKSIRTQEQAVIVEGYLDVIALHQAGFTNAVSPMGTALTEHQLNLLKRLSRNIILALDPDAAGDKATLRGLQVARQSMDREQDPVFDARGLLGYEARLQADIRVTTLPEGMDPDEVANRDPKEWERLVAGARPVVIHVMETLASGRDLEDPKVKTEIAVQVLPLIEDVPSPIERDTYRQRLARLLRVNENALLEFAPPRPRRSGPPRRPPAPTAGTMAAPGGIPPAGSIPAGEAVPHPALISASSSTYTLEMHCLGILLRRPDLLYQVDRRMQAAHLPRLSPEDFLHTDHQSILRLFQESVDQDMAEPLNFVFNSLSLPMMDMADGLLARTDKLDPNDERVLEDLMRGLLTLRRRRLDQELEYRRFALVEAQEGGDIKATQDAQTVVQLAKARRYIDEALKEYTSRAQTHVRQ
jgi:DNA primase